MCERQTNSFINLSTPVEKSKKIPKYLKRSERKLLKSYRMMKSCRSPELVSDHAKQKRHHNHLRRYHEIQRCFSRDRLLNKFCSIAPAQTFRAIKSIRNSKIKKISKLCVGHRTYIGDEVPDGMYESIKNLKTELDSSDNCPEHPDFSSEYGHILD